MSENPVKCSIDPYICSSNEFLDERKVLGAKVFPALNALAIQRGASFLPVDWDIDLSEDQHQQGLSLDLAFKSIKLSAPFFIALVGEDYGIHRNAADPPLSLDESYDANTITWLDKTLLVAASNGNEWILSPDYNSTSLLELKIISASFDDTTYCRYYVKDPALSSFQTISEDGDYQVFKQKQLRSNLAKRGLYVTYYTSIETLCTCLTEDWLKIINQLYPPLNTFQLGGWLLLDEIAHKYYGINRTENYVEYTRLKSCISELNNFCHLSPVNSYDPLNRTDTFHRPSGIHLLRKQRDARRNALKTITQPQYSVCVLNGVRGCGKSSLIAKWSSEISRLLPDNTEVIVHYTASMRSARNIAVFMKRVIIEMRNAFLQNYDDRMLIRSEYQCFAEIREEFLAALNYGPSLIILDGLDEISSCMDLSIVQMKHMDWLPQPLPPDCKIIFTVNNSDLSYKSLIKRKDTLDINIPQLNEEDKTEMLKYYLSVYKKMLPERTTAQILNYKLSYTPLYHTMITHELTDTNVTRALSEHIDLYADSDSITSSTRYMWTCLLKRWIRDYSWTRYSDEADSMISDHIEDLPLQGWVVDALRLLACSRDGLYSHEVLTILNTTLNYNRHRKITPYHWNAFYSAAHSALYQKPNGLIIIAHEHFLEVIDYLLLGNFSPSANDQPTTVKPRSHKSGTITRKVYHQAIVSYFLKRRAATQLQRMEELLTQVEIISDYSRLSALIGLPLVMLLMYGPDISYYPRRFVLLNYYRKHQKEINKKIEQTLIKHQILISEVDDSTDDILLFDINIDVRPNSSRSAWDSRPTTGHSVNVSQSDRSQSIHESDRPHKAHAAERLHSVHESERPQSVHQAERNALEFDSGVADSELNLTENLPVNPHTVQQTQRDSTENLTNKLEFEVNDFVKLDSESNDSEINGIIDLQYLSQTLTNQRFSTHSLPHITPTIDELAQYTLVCAILIVRHDVNKGRQVLTALISWLNKKVPLSPVCLLTLHKVYTTLSRLEERRDNYQSALEYLNKSNEYLLDLPVGCMDHKYKNYLNGCLRLSLTRICIKLNQLTQAEDEMCECRIIMTDLQSTALLQRANYHNSILRAAHHNYAKSIHLMKKCVEYFQLSFGSLHPLVADGCLRLGEILSCEENSQHCDFETAEVFLRKALNIHEETSERSLQTADIYHTLGFIVQRTGLKTMKKEAVKLLQSCLDIRMSLLDSNHEKVKLALYFINDLEISLKLGQFEFGCAKPTDSRNKRTPYSSMTLPDEALAKINKSNNVNKMVDLTNRPKSAYAVERNRNQSRLQKTLSQRPKTAPNYSNIAEQNLHPKKQQPVIPRSDFVDANPSNKKVKPEAFPTMNVIHTQQEMFDTYKVQLSALIKKRSSVSAPNPTPRLGFSEKPVHTHDVDQSSRRQSLNTSRNITLGQTSGINSIVESGSKQPNSLNYSHASAWYHMPNHYPSSANPHANLRNLAQRKKRLMRSRNAQTPLKSNYLTTSKHDALSMIAQYEQHY